MTLIAPSGLVLAPTVLQVQHRVTLGLILIVSGRSIDKRAADGIGALRREQDLLNVAVGNVLQGVEFLVVSGDLDAAFPTGRAVKVQRARIVERAPVDREVVIVKSLVQRLLGDARPESVLTLGELESAPLESPQAHADLFGLRGFDAEAGITLRVDLWVILARLI